MKAVMPLNGFMELTEDNLIAVDGGSAIISGIYQPDYSPLWKAGSKGFIEGFGGACATGAEEFALEAGLFGATNNMVDYALEHPDPPLLPLIIY
ncbi:hypothetical protein ACETAC_05860 [Aceticella autotrophica]|uniref:Uncharacterized protein n=1 Tax=Aceticella autotrophica TaxID=2755338 RepID=A0A974Y746_9THEO|nr:hypothetical protein [Aceticella autotrophica]QSZ26453.1 hypothetical protein ACETAC_05860 [Aceticella autotrophica]